MTMIVAGPCAIESYEQIEELYKSVGGKIDYFRGGIHKYRSLANTYQGTYQALQWVRDLKAKYNVKYCGEIFSKDELMEYGKDFDMIQIGSRNMHNTNLLKLINSYCSWNNKPVLFKRHYAASIQEFVNHSSYLKDSEVYMCLRGIQGMHPEEQRFQPDMPDIARLRELTDSKIVYDASHSSCEKRFVAANALAALEYCPDGLMLEVHPTPAEALSDADQQLNILEFLNLVNKIK